MAGYDDYQDAKRLETWSYDIHAGFYAIIQCAMRRADTDNLDKLKDSFPEEWEDLHARYGAPGGKLKGDE
jgi:hypothetical protein